MLSAFGVDHGEFSKSFDRTKKKLHRGAYKVDDKLEGTKVSNALTDHERRRGYKHGMSPAPKRKPPKYAPAGTMPGTGYRLSNDEGVQHYNRLKYT